MGAQRSRTRSSRRPHMPGGPGIMGRHAALRAMRPAAWQQTTAQVGIVTSVTRSETFACLMQRLSVVPLMALCQELAVAAGCVSYHAGCVSYHLVLKGVV